MPAFAFAVPLVPGRQEAWRRFVQELLGSRRAAYEESRRRLHITREAVWLTQLGPAAFVVTACDIAAPHTIFAELARSPDPFARWLRGGWRTFYGLDLADPHAAIISEPVYAWSAGCGPATESRDTEPTL